MRGPSPAVTPTPRRAALAVTYGVGAASGLAAQALRIPLPWLLGSLLATGLASATRGERPVARGGRQAGQAVVGAALGLYFNPETVAAVVAALPWMLASCAAAVAAGIAGAGVLRRRARLAPATAFFAGIPGGAAEMAVFGERYGGDPAVIALAQALRVAAVVSIVPLALTLAGTRGADPWAPVARASTPRGLVALALACAAAGLLSAAARLPNGWLLGPLGASAVLTAAGYAGAAVPGGLVDAAQVAIGCALGSRFRRDLLRDLRVLLPSIGVAVIQAVVLLGSFAALAAALSGRAFATLLLATAPGGIAEMCLTARTLQLGVPLVTAFHVLRLVVLLTLAPATFRIWRRAVEARARVQRTGDP